MEPPNEESIPLLRIDPAVEKDQVESLATWRKNRQDSAVKQALQALQETCLTPDGEIMPHIIEAVRQGATEGEIVAVMKAVFGTWRERPVF